MDDIDLSDYTAAQFNCIGKELYMSIYKPFTGIFNGNGKTIAGFTYENTDVAVVALFRGVGPGGVIRNLGLLNPDVTINVSPDCDWVLDITCLVADVASGGMVEDCWIEDGRVQGSRCAGLLAGTSAGMIRRCRVSGTVSAWDYAGGAVGLNAGTIQQTVFEGTVEGVEDVGGLCGSNSYGAVDDCSAAGSVSGRENLGGMCGSNEHGAISDSRATGPVTGGGASRYLGGLCGQSAGEIVQCCATGQVTGGTESEYVGGLCGSNNELITDCYAMGPVNGGYDSAHVGGLCGRNNSSGAISNSWAGGHITGNRYTGGLCGENAGLVTDCFWDTQTSQVTTSDGGTGRTTAEMMTLSNFADAGWDFVGGGPDGNEDVWRMCVEGVDYPRLSWEFGRLGDLTCPDGVDLEDLVYLAERWLSGSAAGAADENGDHDVDLLDFAVVADNWGR
jgi:hypothetical protein